MSVNDKKIAVLMASYNSEDTLLPAVNSVLESTAPLHLFIVDNASTKPVSEVLEPNERITILRLDRNSSLPTALNHGIRAIQKQGFIYTARMYFTPPETYEGIKNMLFFNSAICHPTWFMRTDVFEDIGMYNESYNTAQDYDFLCRLAEKRAVANIPEYLLDHRVSSQGLSLKNVNVNYQYAWKFSAVCLSGIIGGAMQASRKV